MQTLTGNTILITGGGTGIGRAMAESFHKLGNQVIISGRRQKVLEDVCAANPGMASFTVDMANEASISAFAKNISTAYPNLNVVIHNAGIMEFEDVANQTEAALDIATRTVATNIMGPIRLTAALLPHLEGKTGATLGILTSGLAYVPLALTPTYSASKAAMHSYFMSLRLQLKPKGIHVVEIAPPYVQTELTGTEQATDPRAMPLTDYITEVMDIWGKNPAVAEVLVERVKPLRFAAQNGNETELFNMLAQMRSEKPA